MNINLRIAKKSDIDLITETYRRIGFKESEFANETIIIAEYNNIINPFTELKGGMVLMIPAYGS